MATIKKGDKFNFLTAIEFKRKDKSHRQFWLFRCDCGKKKIIRIDCVKNEKVKSCGCLYKASNKNKNLKHGKTKTKTYMSWAMMRRRCLNKNAQQYKDYGGRGIKICGRWLNKNGFQNFFDDMGEAPENKTLDRKNNNGNYKPKNCKWSTPKEQANNRRNNKLNYQNENSKANKNRQ